MTVVRAALVQTTWTGDKESMIEAHDRAGPGGRRRRAPR